MKKIRFNLNNLNKILYKNKKQSNFLIQRQKILNKA